MTREEAIETFRVLTRRHGLQWRADVPREDWDRLREVNEVLDHNGRREALGLPVRR